MRWRKGNDLDVGLDDSNKKKGGGKLSVGGRTGKFLSLRFCDILHVEKKRSWGRE